MDSAAMKQKFIERFHMVEHPNVKIEVKEIKNLEPYYEMYFELYNVDFKIDELSFNIVIIASRFEKEHMIRKLTIAHKDDYKEEFSSCISTLQRKRDLSFALTSIYEYAQLRSQREIVAQSLLLQIGNCMTLSCIKEDGHIMKCTCNGTFLFKVSWKIWWNSDHGSFFDLINFEVNTDKKDFHGKVKPVMQNIIKPKTDIEWKKALWQSIVISVQETVSENILETIEMVDAEDTESNRDFIVGPIEISDSDGENVEEDDVSIVDTYIKL